MGASCDTAQRPGLAVCLIFEDGNRFLFQVGSSISCLRDLLSLFLRYSEFDLLIHFSIF